MKIRFHGMAGTNHSWSFVTQNYIKEMLKIGGHEIYIKSTNSLQHFPKELEHLLVPGYHAVLPNEPLHYKTEDGRIIVVDKNHMIPEIEDKHRPYDLEMAYTILYQGPRRFFPETKARAVMWNFESSILPPGWHLYHKSLDYILPSSQFSYDIFANSGIPRDKMMVIHHGVDTNFYNPNIPPYPLKTKKKVKFLHIARPHARKCHDRIIKGYLDTFTGNDDVCLVLKTSLKKPNPTQIFEVDIEQILTDAHKNRKNPAEIEVIDEFIDNMASLHTACDVDICMSSTEGFDLVLLEALACGSLVLSPRYGGQLDFLNDDNSLLIKTSEMLAPTSHQYWVPHPKAVVGDPDINDYKEKLWYLYKNLDKEKIRVKEASKKTVEYFNWERPTKNILELPIPIKSNKIFNRIRVLYIVPYSMYGGGEAWIEQSIKTLNKNKYEPHVAFLLGAPGNMKETLDNMGIDTIDIKKEINPPNEQEVFNYALAALKCLIEANSYHIIHFYNSHAVYQTIKDAISQGLNTRVVETFHSELKWPDSMSKIAKRDDFVSIITTVSNKHAQYLSKLGNKNIVVLTQPIDWNKFKVLKTKQIFDQLNIPNKFTVGFVGRFSQEKNIMTILKCAQLLPDIQFVLVGDGPQKQPLEQIGKQLKNVYFVGQRKDVENFYSAFDVLIMASIVEGLPLVIVEAMGCGTPIVSSDVGGISEIVKNDVNGFLVKNPHDVSSFVNAITKLSSDENMFKLFSNNSKQIVSELEARYNQANINSVYNMFLQQNK